MTRSPSATSRFSDGTTLPDAHIAYATYGELNAARDNAIVLPTWFVGTHADHEWMIGEGAVLDTSRYFVVVPSMFANGLSSSPSNTPAPYDRGAVPATDASRTTCAPSTGSSPSTSASPASSS